MSTLNGLDKYTNSIYTAIKANQTLCKLLKYDYDNPLAEDDIVDTSILYTDKEDQRLFFTPYAQDNNSESRSTLNVEFPILKLDKKNDYYKDIDVDFIVMVHHNLWDLNDGSGYIKQRPNAILQEIVETFNDARTAIGKDVFDYTTLIRAKNGYVSGYKICLNIKDFPLM